VKNGQTARKRNREEAPAVHRFITYVAHAIDRMDMQDWVVVLFIMILVGWICMRGYGSRSNY